MSKKCYTTLFFIVFSLFVFGQSDSTDVAKTTEKTSDKPQNDATENDYKTKGISVSPAHFHLNMKPGEVKTYKISIKNDTEKISFSTVKLT